MIVFFSQQKGNLKNDYKLTILSNKNYCKLLQDNGLPKIKFHDLRHTFTTLLLMNNYDLKDISELFGHSDTIITLNIYFDKDRIVIDCVNGLSNYIDRV